MPSTGSTAVGYVLGVLGAGDVKIIGFSIRAGRGTIVASPDKTTLAGEHLARMERLEKLEAEVERLQQERDAYQAAFRLLAEFVNIGAEKPPGVVMEFFRNLHRQMELNDALRGDEADG